MWKLQIGVFNEDSLKRLDLILAEASNNNVHIIFPFVNFWDDLGGMQWYVDQVGHLYSPAQSKFNPNIKHQTSSLCPAAESCPQLIIRPLSRPIDGKLCPARFFLGQVIVWLRR